MITMPHAVQDYLAQFSLCAVFVTQAGKIGTAAPRGLARRIGNIAAVWWTADAHTANAIITAVGQHHPTSIESAERELKLAADRIGAVLADHDEVVKDRKSTRLNSSHP